jgi:hypothetical protein
VSTVAAKPCRHPAELGHVFPGCPEYPRWGCRDFQVDASAWPEIMLLYRHECFCEHGVLTGVQGRVDRDVPEDRDGACREQIISMLPRAAHRMSCSEGDHQEELDRLTAHFGVIPDPKTPEGAALLFAFYDARSPASDKGAA